MKGKRAHGTFQLMCQEYWRSGVPSREIASRVGCYVRRAFMLIVIDLSTKLMLAISIISSVKLIGFLRLVYVAVAYSNCLNMALEYAQKNFGKC